MLPSAVSAPPRMSYSAEPITLFLFTKTYSSSSFPTTRACKAPRPGSPLGHSTLSNAFSLGEFFSQIKPPAAPLPPPPPVPLLFLFIPPQKPPMAGFPGKIPLILQGQITCCLLWEAFQETQLSGTALFHFAYVSASACFTVYHLLLHKSLEGKSLLLITATPELCTVQDTK